MKRIVCTPDIASEIVNTDIDNTDTSNEYYHQITLDEYAECSLEKSKVKEDAVNHPKHYTSGKYEVIDVIYDMNLPYPLDNVIKYVARHRLKGKPLEDLRKAKFYLDWYINKLEEERKG